MIRNKFKDKILNNEKVITVELAPPKGTNLTKFYENAVAVKDYVDAYNLTDNQRSVVRMSPFACANVLIKENLSPIYQITCRDRNRMAIQSDLIAASAMGVENILALTGDHVCTGDQPESKPVFDLDSVQSLYTISRLNEGFDLADKKLDGATNLFAGAVVNPCVSNLEIHIWRMHEKIRMGAKFFQTQVVFDTSILEEFMVSTRKCNTKIIAGIILVKSLKMAKYLNDFVPGLHIPEWVIKELENSNNQMETGIEITAHLVKEFLSIADGIHIMAIHQEHRLKDIFKKL